MVGRDKARFTDARRERGKRRDMGRDGSGADQRRVGLQEMSERTIGPGKAMQELEGSAKRNGGYGERRTIGRGFDVEKGLIGKPCGWERERLTGQDESESGWERERTTGQWGERKWERGRNGASERAR